MILLAMAIVFGISVWKTKCLKSLSSDWFGGWKILDG